MVFDVKYDLRHKARLVAGGNWTVNDKEDIYSGVVRMDNETMDFHVAHVISEMSSKTEKQKRKSI
jgi:hypothetical protein